MLGSIWLRFLHSRFVQHEREDWEAQERELNRRVAERLRDLDPSCQGTVCFLLNSQVISANIVPVVLLT